MSVPRAKLSRRDAALLAGARLLPVPLLAQSGLSIPLPGAVERGLGSLVTLDTNDPRTGFQVTGQASTGRQDERLSARGWLRIVPAKDAAALPEDSNLPVPGFGSTDGIDRPAGDGGSGGSATPPGSGPEGAGGGPGSPGDSESPGARPGSPEGSESPGAESPGAEGTGEGGSAPPTLGAVDNDAAVPASESVLTVSLTGPGSSSAIHRRRWCRHRPRRR